MLWQLYAYLPSSDIAICLKTLLLHKTLGNYLSNTMELINALRLSEKDFTPT
jgi:hypothetical protein